MYLITDSCVENGPYRVKEVVQKVLWGRFCTTLSLDKDSCGGRDESDHSQDIWYKEHR